MSRLQFRVKTTLNIRKGIYGHTTKLSMTLFPQVNVIPDNKGTDTNISIEQLSDSDLAKIQNSGDVDYDLISKETVLSVPSADIQGPVLQGKDSHTMDKGFWHFPLSQPPGHRGNTVIIGHRFGKLPPARDTFFNLDLIKIGDQITISQTDDDFTYTVVKTKVVDKFDRSILLNTTDYRLTLVTCHPLWTSEKRLVIIAKLDRVGTEI